MSTGNWTDLFLGDCERWMSGLVAQPINAFSSLVFVIVGALFWRNDRVLALATAAVGIGSFWFHAQTYPISTRFHDLTIIILAALVLHRVWKAGAWRQAMPGLLILAVGLVIWYPSREGGPWCDPDSLLQLHAIWHVLAALATASLYRPLTAATTERANGSGDFTRYSS